MNVDSVIQVDDIVLGTCLSLNHLIPCLTFHLPTHKNFHSLIFKGNTRLYSQKKVKNSELDTEYGPVVRQWTGRHN